MGPMNPQIWSSFELPLYVPDLPGNGIAPEIGAAPGIEASPESRALHASSGATESKFSNLTPLMHFKTTRVTLTCIACISFV